MTARTYTPEAIAALVAAAEEAQTAARLLASSLDQCTRTWRALGGSPDPWLVNADAALAEAERLGLSEPKPTMETHGYMSGILRQAPKANSPFCPLDDALRPFTTEPSSWLAYLRERWGDEWQAMGDGPTHEDFSEARAAYRARYGVEP